MKYGAFPFSNSAKYCVEIANKEVKFAFLKNKLWKKPEKKQGNVE